MNPKTLCKYACALYPIECPMAASEISTIFDYTDGNGGQCTNLVLKRNNRVSDPFNLTDWGNAQRLVLKYGDEIRYCPEMVMWYIWDGSVWKIDSNGHINQLSKMTITDLWNNAQYIDDPAYKKKLVGFAISSENQNKIKCMIESAQNEPGIPIGINDFDKNKDIICVDNGILNLKTSELYDFQKGEYITKKIPTPYNPDAKCSIFEDFLSTIFKNDEELIGFIKRFFGYCLTGHTSEQVFCIFYGHGSNGKGTLTDTIMDIMGDYAKTTEPDTIIKKKYERSSTNDLADLKGARLVITSENEMNQELDEGRIKRITGQDRIKCRFLYREFFEYVPEFCLVLMTNHEPTIKAQDYSIWRRVLKIPFKVTIPKEEWDLQLRDKLYAEREGILKWLVEGAKEWYDIGLNVPETVTKATEEYKEESDIIGEFIGLLFDVGNDKQVVNKDIYLVYTGWCAISGHRPFAPTTFGKALTERNFANKTIGKFRGKTGLDLKEEVKQKLEELKNIDDERALMSTLSTFIRVFLESPIENVNYTANKKTPSNVDTYCPMPKIISTNEEQHENRYDECHSITKESRKINEIPLTENNNSEMVKIKLKIPKSEFVIGDIQYSLKRGDIAEVPRSKAEKLIMLNMASNVSEGVHS